MVSPVPSISLPTSRSQSTGLFLKAYALFIILSFSAPLIALAQDTEIDCSRALSDAETAYFNGAFDRTLALLQPCVDAEAYASDEAQRAYILLGRTHFVLGQSEEATTAVEALFMLNPDYTPPAQFPPNFVAFITSVKDEMTRQGRFETQEETPELEPIPPPITEVQPVDADSARAEPQRRRRKGVFLLGGGAALAAGVTAAILISGSGGKQSGAEWPFPPGRP